MIDEKVIIPMEEYKALKALRDDSLIVVSHEGFGGSYYSISNISDKVCSLVKSLDVSERRINKEVKRFNNKEREIRGLKRMSIFEFLKWRKTDD